jgi:hypothetical protein
MRTQDGNIVVIDSPRGKGYEVYEVDPSGLEMYLDTVPFDKVPKIRDTLVRRAVRKHEEETAKARRLYGSVIRLAHAKPELRADLLPLLKKAELEPTHAIVSCPDCGAQLQIGIDFLQHRTAKTAELPRPLLRDRNALFLLGQIAKGNSRIFVMDERPPGWVLLERLGLAEKDPLRPPKGTYAKLTDYGKQLVESLPKS